MFRQTKRKKPPPKERLLIKCARSLTLTGFETALCFVDYVNAAFATHNAAVTMPILERAERIANLHGLSPVSWRGPAPGCGQLSEC
ncbi:MAG: hypothetical protein ACI82J_002031 [Sulfitobacter litoralis]|jgi:hypothetical protein|tara:strand:- start:4 stop:261 length:258 start_codon:yes stop_codon:yes gene_type:complete